MLTSVSVKLSDSKHHNDLELQSIKGYTQFLESVKLIAEDLKRKVPKVKQSQEEEEEEKKSSEELNKYEEIYAAQITSLQDLGFTELPEIITALKNADGQLELAIDFLFTKQTKEVISISPPNSERSGFLRHNSQTQKTQQAGEKPEAVAENEDDNLLDEIDQQNELVMIQERLLLEKEKLQMEQDMYRRREQDLRRCQEEAMQAKLEMERAVLKAKQQEIEKRMAEEEARAREMKQEQEEIMRIKMEMEERQHAMKRDMEIMEKNEFERVLREKS